MNIKDEKFRALLADNDMEKKRQMVCQSQRLNMSIQENSKVFSSVVKVTSYLDALTNTLQTGT